MFAHTAFAQSDWEKEKGTYAVFKTSMGTIVCKLFTDKAPKTVENMTTLAGKNFYNGTIFHRIIPGFMVQGGDPTGTGRGGPGYMFDDEFDKSLQFTKPGILAMANAGRNTNGSQFFITYKATPHLNNKHTIFGEVVEGFEVAMKMGSVPKGRADKPIKDVVLEKLEIVNVK